MDLLCVQHACAFHSSCLCYCGSLDCRSIRAFIAWGVSIAYESDEFIDFFAVEGQA